MSLVNRGELRSAMATWVGASEEMRGLEAAMKVLYPKGKRPSIRTMAETVLFAVLHMHEQETHGVLSRLDNAMARLLEDLDAMRRGESIQGRTAGMHAEDLATIAKALDDLSTLEARVKHTLDTDPSGSWADQLKIDLARSMSSRRGAGRAPRGVRPPVPTSFAGGTSSLASAIATAGPTPHGVWSLRRLPSAIRRAAHNLVVAGGGDVAATVRRLLQTGGADADAMVIAVLWAERRIAPGTELSQAADHAVHQTRVTGLDFEWTGQASPNSLGQTVGIDGIAGGFVVDGKHSATPLEELPHLTDELAPPKPALEDRVPGLPTDVQMKASQTKRNIAAETKKLTESQHKYLDQMRRQLDFARDNGLRGINWVCNDAELADAFRELSHRLPDDYRSMQVNFTVGGLR